MEAGAISIVLLNTRLYAGRAMVIKTLQDMCTLNNCPEKLPNDARSGKTMY